MPLPTQKTPPKSSISDLTVLLYGPGKIGKSTWCSKADGALFLATEPGLNSLEVFQEPIESWDKLLEKAAEIAAGGHDFKTIILDTVDNAYRMCAQYICAKYKVEHESDLAYGKGYALVNNEFLRVLGKLALLPYGLFLVSHSQEKEVETRTGKIQRVVPTLPDKARKIVLGFVDVILYCEIEPAANGAGPRRVLRTKPTTHYEAGDRTKRLPETIEFDYAAFAGAFAAPPAAPPPAVAAPAAPAPAPTPAAASRPRAVAAR